MNARDEQAIPLLVGEQVHAYALVMYAEGVRAAIKAVGEHPHPGDDPAAFYGELLASLLPNGEEATAAAATATPDFFQPGHTYTREHHAATIRFLVRYIDASPCGTYRIAFGWRVEDGDVTWSPSDSDDMGGWVDVTEAGDL